MLKFIWQEEQLHGKLSKFAAKGKTAETPTIGNTGQVGDASTPLGPAWFGNNMNPVSGHGILVLAAFGVVVRALMGTLTILKKPSDEAREDNF